MTGRLARHDVVSRPDDGEGWTTAPEPPGQCSHGAADLIARLMIDATPVTRGRIAIAALRRRRSVAGPRCHVLARAFPSVPGEPHA